MLMNWSDQTSNGEPEGETLPVLFFRLHAMFACLLSVDKKTVLSFLHQNPPIKLSLYRRII